MLTSSRCERVHVQAACCETRELESKTTLCYAVESARRSKMWYAVKMLGVEAMVRGNV
jgi:hypothetical protein